ncbi:hypothetical protein [Bacillus atrophaeus]
MSNLSQEQINADLFNEVRRLKEENRELRLKIEDCTCFKYVEDEEGV